jgi:hypothetical protein
MRVAPSDSKTCRRNGAQIGVSKPCKFLVCPI